MKIPTSHPSGTALSSRNGANALMDMGFTYAKRLHGRARIFGHCYAAFSCLVDNLPALGISN
jgi:hypothetical protein